MNLLNRKIFFHYMILVSDGRYCRLNCNFFAWEIAINFIFSNLVHFMWNDKSNCWNNNGSITFVMRNSSLQKPQICVLYLSFKNHCIYILEVLFVSFVWLNGTKLTKNRKIHSLFLSFFSKKSSMSFVFMISLIYCLCCIFFKAYKHGIGIMDFSLIVLFFLTEELSTFFTSNNTSDMLLTCKSGQITLN